MTSLSKEQGRNYKTVMSHLAEEATENNVDKAGISPHGRGNSHLNRFKIATSKAVSIPLLSPTSLNQ